MQSCSNEWGISADADDEVDDWHERETLPPPTVREGKKSQMRLRVTLASAVVDVVVCDMTKDPRSEEFIAVPACSEVRATIAPTTTPDLEDEDDGDDWVWPLWKRRRA